MIDILHTTNLFPASHQALHQQTTKQLSILDATVLKFTPAETVLVYDESTPTPTVVRALERVLDSYPQWSGRLHRVPYDGATRRHGRLALTWGAADDPGIVFVEARTDATLASLVPAERERDWDASAFPAAKLVPDTPISTSNLEEALPSVTVQLTTFSCGAMALGVRMAHPLADAQTLSIFLRHWAAAAADMVSAAPTPLFDPPTLDARAAAASPDTPSLPFHHYDWWVSKPDSVPDELRDEPHDPPGYVMPWAEWDVAGPVSHYVLHFSGVDLERLWNATAHGIHLSRLDALLAHLWSRINTARGLEGDVGAVHLDYTLGLRGRLDPPLEDGFVGSPLAIAAVSAPGRAVSTAPAEIARLIRSTVSSFTPQAVAGYLFEKQKEQSPQRIWQAFLGRRHVLVTSWIHTHLYGVQFTPGHIPRYVECVMPKCDGLLQVMDARPSPHLGEKRHWSDYGVDVQLHLAKATMEKLLSDPQLRGEASA